jgi:iterative type I PKS product template protein
MALTLGEYLYQKLVPRCKEVPMNVTNMTVTNAQIAQKDRSKSQVIQIEGEIDLATQATKIHWYTVAEGGVRSQEFFATATVLYEDPAAWQIEWRKTTHLLNDRIETLDRMAAEGTANKLSKGMAYNLFRNVVDYTDKYCGMQSVVLNGFEAYADIVLVPERHGTWHTPPHWIDSVFHLAGFVMNGSDASNTKEFFYITPGWSDFRLLKPLASGVKYRSYVRMFQSEEDPNMFAGDIYAMQEGTVVAVLGQIRFRRVPRFLMERLFVAPDALKGKNERREQPVAPSNVPKVPIPNTILAPKVVPVFQKPSIETEATQVPPVEEKVSVVAIEPAKPAASEGSGTSTPVLIDSNPVIADCLRLIARETGLDVEEFSDEASFVELGIDSLMSLVLSEKFRTELRLEVQSSIFLECPSVKDLKEYLEQYC